MKGGGSLVNQIMISGYIGGKNIISNVIVREATLSLCRVRCSLLFSCVFNNEIRRKQEKGDKLSQEENKLQHKAPSTTALRGEKKKKCAFCGETISRLRK